MPLMNFYRTRSHKRLVTVCASFWSAADSERPPRNVPGFDGTTSTNVASRRNSNTRPRSHNPRIETGRSLAATHPPPPPLCARPRIVACLRLLHFHPFARLVRVCSSPALSSTRRPSPLSRAPPRKFSQTSSSGRNTGVCAGFVLHRVASRRIASKIISSRLSYRQPTKENFRRASTGHVRLLSATCQLDEMPPSPFKPLLIAWLAHPSGSSRPAAESASPIGLRTRPRVGIGNMLAKVCEPLVSSIEPEKHSRAPRPMGEMPVFQNWT